MASTLVDPTFVFRAHKHGQEAGFIVANTTSTTSGTWALDLTPQAFKSVLTASAQCLSMANTVSSTPIAVLTTVNSTTVSGIVIQGTAGVSLTQSFAMSTTPTQVMIQVWGIW